MACSVPARTKTRNAVNYSPKLNGLSKPCLKRPADIFSPYAKDKYKRKKEDEHSHEDELSGLGNGSKADPLWFEKNILDENCDIKESVADHLMGLEGVCLFSLRLPNDRFKRIHLAITSARETKAFEDELAERYGEEIRDFVNLIETKTTLQITPMGNTLWGTLPAASGDGIGTQGNSGTLGMFARDSDNQLYAITCYHALDKERNRKVPDSVSSAQYYYISSSEGNRKSRRLGRFASGKYDEYHDIGIVKIDRNVPCDCEIKFRDGAEILSYLETIPDVAIHLNEQKKKDPKKKVIVKIIGFTSGECEGILTDFNGFAYGNQRWYRKVYLLESPNGGPFIKGGDSGSLVMYKDNEGKFHPFAYIVANVGPNAPDGQAVNCTIAYNLQESLQACDKNLLPLFQNPCN